MENATKALMMAGGVLIGIMILSLGVYLYSSLSSYIIGTQEQMEANALAKFNAQFLKYINIQKDEHGADVEEFKLTLQDIITAANLAYSNNNEYVLTSADAGPSTYYVKITAKINGITQNNGLENLTEEEKDSLLSQDTGYNYKCSTQDIKISEQTGRVYEINFK